MGLLFGHKADLMNQNQSRSKPFQSLQEILNCVLYFAHIGSRRALEQIDKERKNGTKIFVETCPSLFDSVS